MLINNTIIILIIVSINIIFFALGYLVAVANAGNTNYTSKKKTQQSIQQQKLAEIEIDNRKLVVDINTNNLEKKYDTLGDTKQTQETISSSVSKLKSMKG